MLTTIAPLLSMTALMLLCSRASLSWIVTGLLIGYVLLTTSTSDWKPGTQMYVSYSWWVQGDDYWWFWVTKKWSVIAACFVVFLNSFFPRSKIPGYVFTVGVGINILEAFVLCAMDQDYVAAIAMLLIVPFYPVMTVKNDVWTHEVDGRTRWMDARTYVWWYCIVFAVMHFTIPCMGRSHLYEGASLRLYTIITCLAPLLSMELGAVFGRSYNPLRDFMGGRALGLLWAFIIDTTIDKRFMCQLDIAVFPVGFNETLNNSPALRNALQATFMLIGFAYFKLVARADKGADQQSKAE